MNQNIFTGMMNMKILWLMDYCGMQTKVAKSLMTIAGKSLTEKSGLLIRI